MCIIPKPGEKNNNNNNNQKKKNTKNKKKSEQLQQQPTASGRRWVQEREWKLTNTSTILIRCGSAVNSIGVDLYSTMVGDRMLGHYYKDSGGDILGVRR
mmetsp:Transcript_14538/g.27564  ORF Transcript_14538/g.27564 Transcript_14538/m.27564 type:complete len:99 (+) Transcript_14538:437-733(+)